MFNYIYQKIKNLFDWHMDLSKTKKIYMIGIKGVGMAMLAQFLKGNGIEIMGSDTAEKFMTDEALERSGIRIIEGFDANNIPKDADLIVYSTAYNRERNVEVAAALDGKIKTLTYAQALGDVFNQRYGIAVVGSHGKTTTTAWLGYVLEKAGKQPSVLVGSKVKQWENLSITGKSNYLIIEADEYQNKLQYFNPRGVLLNNIDYDHPDFFPTEADYENVFIEFIKKIPKKGFLVTNFDDPIISRIANVNSRGKVISYAINAKADFVAYDIKLEAGRQFFKVRMDGEEASELGDFSIQLAGKHNIYNALAVIAASIELEVGLKDLRTYLSEFNGTARRMEKIGEYNGAAVYDDYAHHPTEIRATLAGARELFGDKNIITVFHPHTFTRTKALFKDFAKSFDDTDELIVLDIYGSAREEQGGTHSSELVEAIMKNGHKNTKYIPTKEEAEKYLRENIDHRDVVILMGAGDVFRIGEKLIFNS